MARLGIVSDDRFSLHMARGFHPERPERLAAARRGAAKVIAETVAIAARAATAGELERVHGRAHIVDLDARLAAGVGQIDADTYFSAGSRDAAWFAAGGGCALVDALIDGTVDIGALLARPPGHHATRDRSMGFCLLNNIAVAAAHARSRGLSRIAIVDWDVHHGNGTEEIFASDRDVLFISLHQSPLYPGSGAAETVGKGDALGRTVNIPLPSGSDARAYRMAFDRVVLPILAAAKPELLLISAGFDAHERDPIANMALRGRDFGWMASRLREAADADAQGRIGFFLEGGYDLAALEEGTALALGGLVQPGPRTAIDGSAASVDERAAVERVVTIQKEYWPGVL